MWEKAKGFGGAHDELNSLHSLGATWILVARVPVKIRWRFHPRPRATAAPRAPRVSPPRPPHSGAGGQAFAAAVLYGRGS